LEEVNCCDVPNKAADDTDYTDVETICVIRVIRGFIRALRSHDFVVAT
jgi:hypothetical protein